MVCMTNRILDPIFFSQDGETVAEALLGCVLVRNTPDGTKKLLITEVELYDGKDDLASHASKDRTKRTEVMYGSPGHWYIYLIYGMYHMINIVTRESGYPSAILIRGTREISGPGRLSGYLHIDRTVNAKPANRKTGFWIEAPAEKPLLRIERTPRIGIDYAGEPWKSQAWRFVAQLDESVHPNHDKLYER